MVVMVIVLSRWTLRMSSLGRTDLETVDLYLGTNSKGTDNVFFGSKVHLNTAVW